jgi:hypothetical protein
MAWYQWKPPRSIMALLALTGVLAVGVTVVAIAQLLSSGSPKLRIGLDLFLATYCLLLAGVGPSIAKRQVPERSKTRASWKLIEHDLDDPDFLVIIPAMTAGNLLFAVLIFAFLTRDASALWTGLFESRGATSIVPWVYFGLDNLLDSVLFDGPSIYDLHLSRIEPHGFFGRSIVLLFRLAIDISLIHATLSTWRIWRKRAREEKSQ